jgi:hypothetical protein
MRDHSNLTTVLDGDAQAGVGTTELRQVPPLDYVQLRLLAECAACLQRDADFAFTPEGTLEITDRAQDDAVLVPTHDRSKYPRNVVRLQVKPPHPDGSAEELRLEPGFADAVFWSDSAVHKFVFPYVTSIAGYRAGQVLADLQAAWNHYPTDRVTVYALAHVVRHPEGTPLRVENRIQVVYAERQPDGTQGTSLALASLEDFLNAYPPAQPSAGPDGGESAIGAGHGPGAATRCRVGYRRGVESSRRQHPDYATLRALAEYACSLAGEPRYFLFKAGENGFRERTTPDLPALEAGDIVIPAYTPAVPAHRPRLHGVWCDSEDGGTANVAAGSDAMFWSDGAVEQFMFPYYASKGGLHLGLGELQDMARIWRHPSKPWRAGEEAGGPERADAYGAGDGLEGGAEDVGTAYALIHLSSSVYIQATSAGADESPAWHERAEPSATTAYLSPRRDVGVLSSSGGEARVLRAGAFMERRRPA